MVDKTGGDITTLLQKVPTMQHAAQVPGVSIALVREAEVVWAAASGLACKNPVRPVTSHTIFQAASLSKPLFAYAVLGLEERGELDLDAPLISYLPEPYLPDDPLLSEVTARRVLCHMTGWPNWRPEGGSLVRERPPGQSFGYSGEGYIYLQTVVEHIVRQPLDMYMREAVLDPLGMHSSSYAWAAAGDPSVAQAHDDTGQPITPYVGDRPEASSSLHTTPSDYARFVCALLSTETTPGHLSAQSVAKMLHPQVRLSTNVAWGLGWGLENSRGRPILWHWGDNPGYKSLAMAAPAERVGVVIMTNGDRGLVVCNQIVHTVLGDDHPGLDWLATAFYGAPALGVM